MAEDGEVEDAARVADIHERILSFPDGYCLLIFLKSSMCYKKLIWYFCKIFFKGIDWICVHFKKSECKLLNVSFESFLVRIWNNGRWERSETEWWREAESCHCSNCSEITTVCSSRWSKWLLKAHYLSMGVVAQLSCIVNCTRKLIACDKQIWKFLCLSITSCLPVKHGRKAMLFLPANVRNLAKSLV